MDTNVNAPSNFIRTIIDDDLAAGKRTGVVTRFPPEPNGYLHIGHAKSICLNFGLAKDYKGTCHLRFDDTNPEKEEVEYIESIKRDVRWLGFDWGKHLYYASDYFEQLYNFAVELIKKGKAYVCDLSAEEIREYRGTLKEPGKNSPYRDRGRIHWSTGTVPIGTRLTGIGICRLPAGCLHCRFLHVSAQYCSKPNVEHSWWWR